MSDIFMDDVEFESWDDEDRRLIFALFFLVKDRAEQKIEGEWRSFAESLAMSSSLLPDNAFLNIIDRYSEAASTTLQKGTILYRARKTDFSETGLGSAERRAWERMISSLDAGARESIGGMLPENAIGMIAASRNVEKLLDEFLAGYMIARDEAAPYLGLDESGSGAPPPERVAAGRANPAGIPVLYASESLDVAIAEMRPVISDVINIAVVEVTKPLKLYDYVAAISAGSDSDGAFEFGYMSAKFSRPCGADLDDYLPNQYISEYLAARGFDGIRYKSSVSENGSNVALFDTSEGTRGYKIKSSKPVSIKSIDVCYEELGLEQ